ncbi:MAG TPA: hypothetical protein VIK18_14625 [Pirellulales bacterium]
MATRLNEHHSDSFHLPPESYLAMAGRTDQGIVGKIRAAMADRFPHATLDVPEPPSDAVEYIYSYLARDLPFAEEFELAPTMTFGAPGGIEVAAFKATFNSHKAKDRALRKQVTILDYRGYDDFIVRLNTTSEHDDLILAKIKPEETMAATLEAVEQRIKASGEKSSGDEAGLPRESDFLTVPFISLGVERDYPELTKRGFENQAMRGLLIGQARQGIRFYLDQQGARLESRSEMHMKSEVPVDSRFFVFNRAFLVYLKQKNASAPYLAIWVANDELLQRH